MNNMQEIVNELLHRLEIEESEYQYFWEQVMGEDS
jgi:hypothetical protein